MPLSSETTLVARLRSAGAIVPGKTDVPEMGAGAISHNPVCGAIGNAFNPALSADGSSGASGACSARSTSSLRRPLRSRHSRGRSCIWNRSMAARRATTTAGRA
ncbi:amidase family protein [Corticibacter populi]|uniref:amidase family protein n=1 Tax=Corticibacter populi TaxID=1550736 RepID=UPI001473D6EB